MEQFGKTKHKTTGMPPFVGSSNYNKTEDAQGPEMSKSKEFNRSHAVTESTFSPGWCGSVDLVPTCEPKILQLNS